MSLYIHHVPGRLRVRTRAFRCSPGRAAEALARLRALDGIHQATHNADAGSLTVLYDPRQRTHGELLAVLEDLGCIGGGRAHSGAAADTRDGQLAGLFGKALLGALAQNVANRSVATLVGALL